LLRLFEFMVMLSELCDFGGGLLYLPRQLNQVGPRTRPLRPDLGRLLKSLPRLGRPHVAAKQMLEVMPKTLAPRLHGQSQKAIETTLAEFADNLAAVLRQSL
jgi:hypothetical protein